MVGRWSRREGDTASARSATAPTAAGLLDAMAGHVAVLDHHGVVVAVNRAWSTYAARHGGSAAATGPGTSYVAVCERASGPGSLEALRVGAAVRRIARGEGSSFALTYPCPSPGLDQWFTVHVQAFHDRSGLVLVVHEDVTDRHSTEVRLEQRASQDALTGLGNRQVLTLGLTVALAAQATAPPGPTGVGLLCVDLDDFKPVNDTHGHAVGDEVLQAVATRLRGLSRPGDTVARLGGDEFAVCAPGMTVDGLTGLARRVTRELARPHLIRDVELTVSASVGAHLATHGADATAALDAADRAMYRVKHAPAPGPAPLRHRRPGADRPVVCRPVLTTAPPTPQGPLPPTGSTNPPTGLRPSSTSSRSELSGRE